MSKAEATAIIYAIRDSVDFLMRNGISIRQGISNSTADAAHVDGLLTTYAADIEALVGDIPDDSVPDNNG